MTEKPPAAVEPKNPAAGGGIRPIFLTIIICGLLSIFLTGYFSLAFFGGEGAKNTTTLIVPKGAGVAAVAKSLEDHQAIADDRLFSLGVVLHQAQSELQAGEYTVQQGASMATILKMLRTGDTVSRKLSIPEGLTVKQIIARLDAVSSLTGTIEVLPTEGSLLPETYHYSLKDSRQDIIDRMYNSMQSGLADLWVQRQEGLPLASPEDAVILASIIEKETSLNGERRHIAGVFINRLRQGIPLQSDPTIIYGISGGEPLGRGLRRSEIKGRTDYNTYHFKGLPPGPISNPGIKAIAAVLNPLKTEDIFFVADGTGGHAFAATYKEHQKNVRAWRASRK